MSDASMAPNAPRVGEQLAVHGIATPLVWDVAPVWANQTDDRLSITAGEQTDLFRDPQGQVNTANSPRLLFSPDPQCTLSARLAVEFDGTYDAGVLMVYVSETSWAKLCFELSPQGQPMVVTVVTNGTSDDCNSTAISEGAVHLRVSALGSAYAFHFSLDGVRWNLVRYFALHEPQGARIGFSAQAPLGARCTAHFSAIRYDATCITDIRSGE